MAILSKSGYSLNKISPYFNKMAFGGIRNVWSLKSMAPIAFIIALLFAFSSCEEEDLEEDEQQTAVLQSFTEENKSLQVIGGGSMSIIPGELPYLTTGRDSIVPEGAMLFVPQKAYEDDVVDRSEMLALIAVPGSNWILHQKENVPGSEWLRFSGGDFFPGSKWTPGNDELSVPGDEWMPDELSELEVFFYSGEQEASDFLGTMNLSDHQIPWPSADETKSIDITKEKAALAVPASQLLNINMELNTNLSEAIYEPAESIDVPVEAGSSYLPSDPAADVPDTTEFISGVMVTQGTTLKNNGSSSPLGMITVSGQDFFTNGFFVPENVSVLTAPMTEVLEKSSDSPYASKAINSDTRILFFTSDYFVEPPYDIYTVTEPGEELFVGNTQVVLAPSIMNINQGLTLAISPGKLMLTDNLDGTYWPQEYYHPGGFEFPGIMYPPETSPELLPIRFSGYSPEAIQQMGVMVQPEGLR